MSLERRSFSLGDASLKLYIFIDGNNVPWFKAREIAVFVGYRDGDYAIRAHVADTNKLPWWKLMSGGGDPPEIPSNWQPTTIFISEAGLYELMLSSKLPDMARFRDWVTADVLPSIRKTGQYDGSSSVISFAQYRNDMIEKDRYMAIELAAAREERLQNMKIITEMIPHVVKRPNNHVKNHVLYVYHSLLYNSIYKHRYRGIRRQKCSLNVVDIENTEKLIYSHEEPNAINAFNRIKDHLGQDFKCKHNIIYCNITPKKFVNKLNLTYIYIFIHTGI